MKAKMASIILSGLILVAPALVMMPSAHAAQIGVQTMTNIIPTSCTTPPSVSTFQPSDPQATLYFVLNNCSSGDRVAANWYKPDSSLYTTYSWNPIGNPGNYCFWDWISVANNPPASTPGNWTVRISVNGGLLSSLNFTIAGSAQRVLGVQTMTNIIPTSCTTPPSVSTFQPSDPQATLYFVLNNCSSGDRVAANWYKPDSSLYTTYSWNPIGNPGNYCFWDWISVANNPPASTPGNWTVRISVNGGLLSSLNFTIAQQANPTLAVHTVTNIIPTSCTTPPSVSTFQSTEKQATSYFLVNNCRQGDRLYAYWLKPDSSVYFQYSWNPIGNPGNYCFWNWIPIANNPPASTPGNWTVQVLLNGSVLFKDNFTILAQPNGSSQTSTGFFYPLGTDQLRQNCAQRNGGTWLGRDRNNGGCYLLGLYHNGFDMFFNNGKDAFGMPVYAIATGTVKYVSSGPSSGWTSGGTANIALVILHTASDGTQFFAVYGHLQQSLNVYQVGDVVTGGTQIGTIGSLDTGNHVHFGIFPNLTRMPASHWGNLPNSSWPDTNGAVDPLNWITTKAPQCQNGGTTRYTPNGSHAIHPNGTLIKLQGGDGTIYVVQNGSKRAITNRDVLNTLYGFGVGFDFRDAITISAAEFNSYPTGPIVSASLPGNGKSQPDGRLIQQWGGSEISIVTDSGHRRPFGSAATFLNLGYQFCNVAGVSDYQSYPTEATITQ
jgi:murein DD-endopeptidase MepM/ murein hydrolase activator NlpD